MAEVRCRIVRPGPNDGIKPPAWDWEPSRVSPEWQSLVGALAFYVPILGWGAPRDVVSGIIGTPIGASGNQPISPSNHGPVMEALIGSDAGYAFGLPPGLAGLHEGPYTFETLCFMTGSSNLQTYGIPFGAEVTGQTYSATPWLTTATGNWGFSIKTTGTRRARYTVDHIDGEAQWVHFLIRYAGGANYPEVFINGELLEGGLSDAGSGSNLAWTFVHIGRDSHDSMGAVKGYTSYARIFDREVTDDEITLLYEDPHGLARPARVLYPKKKVERNVVPHRAPPPSDGIRPAVLTTDPGLIHPDFKELPLAFAWETEHNGRTNQRDLVSGVLVNDLGTSWSTHEIIDSPYGKALNFPDTGTGEGFGWEDNLPGMAMVSRGSITIECLLRFSKLTDHHIVCFGRQLLSGSNNGDIRLWLDVSGGQHRVEVRRLTNGSYPDISTAYGAVVADEWYHIIATVEGGLFGSRSKIWINGVDQGASIYSGTGDYESTTDSAVIGDARYYDNAPICDISFVRAYKGLASDGFAQNLFSNPWGALTPARPIYPAKKSTKKDTGAELTRILAAPEKDALKPVEWLWNSSQLQAEYKSLATGLVSLLPMTEGVGDPYDVVRQEYPDMQYGATWLPTQRGMATKCYSATKGRIYYSNDILPSVWEDPIECSVLVWKGQTVNQGYRRCFANETNVASVMLQGVIDAGSSYYDAVFRIGSNALNLDYGSVVHGSEDVWLFINRASGMEIWQNGVLVASNLLFAGRNTDSGGFSWGGWRATDYGGNFPVYLYGMWSKALTAEEISLVSSDPFGLIRKVGEVYVPKFRPVYGRILK